MKIKSVLSVAAGCILMLCGCKDDKPKYGAPMNVKVFGVTGRPDLPANMKVGLFVGEPVNVENVCIPFQVRPRRSQRHRIYDSQAP